MFTQKYHILMYDMEDIIEPPQELDDQLLQKIKSEEVKPRLLNIQKKQLIKENNPNYNGKPLITSELSRESRKKYEDYEKIESIKNIRSLDKIMSITIPDIAHDLLDLEKSKMELINAINLIKTNNIDIFNTKIEQEIYEPRISYTVEPALIKNMIICSVDGSFVTRNYHGLDISLSRAIGVVYKFDENELPQITYYPDKKGMENYKLTRILQNVSEEEVSTQISIERAQMEISLANEMITKSTEKIDMMILDGSILTEPLNLIFSQNDGMLENYIELINQYRKLYHLCAKNEILLVGAVKDTRSSTFRKILNRRLPQIIKQIQQLTNLNNTNYRVLLKYFSDLDFFRRLLSSKERSCVFSINSIGNSWLPRQLDLIKKELSECGVLINEFEFFALYLKPIHDDFPLRIEFCLDQKIIQNKEIGLKSIHETAQKICSLLLPISSKIPGFALPIPQMEAHLRCKLNSEDMDTIMNLLERKIADEINNFTKNQTFGDCFIQKYPNLDDFSIRNNFLFSKRRDKFPI